MKQVAVLVAASPTPGFYSQISALSIALRSLAWADWNFTLHVYFAGAFDLELHQRWLPHLHADISWSSEQRFAELGDWAQSDDVFRCGPRDADVILTLDADTFPLASLSTALDRVLEEDIVAGVIAHYPFPRFPACSVREGWERAARGVIDVPLEFAFSHTLMPPEAPAELRLTPFYVNGGVVFFSRKAFEVVSAGYLTIRPRLMARMADGDFAGQAAVTLAITASGTKTALLPMRYNFPNDPIADQLYPGELASAMIFHYLRTDAFDRQQIFATAEGYAKFLSLPLSGSNRVFQQHVQRVIGAAYPFNRA